MCWVHAAIPTLQTIHTSQVGLNTIEPVQTKCWCEWALNHIPNQWWLVLVCEKYKKFSCAEFEIGFYDLVYMHGSQLWHTNFYVCIIIFHSETHTGIQCCVESPKDTIYYWSGEKEKQKWHRNLQNKSVYNFMWTQWTNHYTMYCGCESWGKLSCLILIQSCLSSSL